MKILFNQNVNGCWFWKLVGQNGETLSVSESYSSKTKCLKTAKAVGEAISKGLGLDLSKVLILGPTKAVTKARKLPKTPRATRR